MHVNYINKCIANRKINDEENEKVGAVQRNWTCVQLHERFYVNSSRHSLLKYSEISLHNISKKEYYYDNFCTHNVLTENIVENIVYFITINFENVTGCMCGTSMYYLLKWFVLTFYVYYDKF